MFYFCNVGSGGAATKVIGRSQTLSVEVGITTARSSASFLMEWTHVKTSLSIGQVDANGKK